MLNFFIHRIDLIIEGYKPELLLTYAMENDILLKNIYYISEIEIRATVSKNDFGRLKKLSGHKFKVDIIKERGVAPLLKPFVKRIGLSLGFLIAVAIILYKQSFISEIRIEGYRSIPETKIRERLVDSGLYIGSSRYKIDSDKIKNDIYINFDNISYVGIELQGSLATVIISENGNDSSVDSPDNNVIASNIVASKDAIIERVIPLQGEECVKPGDYVTRGAILITGEVLINNTTYDTSRDSQYRYVRAMGEVWARVRYTWTSEYPADTLYDSDIRDDSDQSFEKDMKNNPYLNREIRNKVGEGAHIVNKELKFDENDNIISVTIMVETIEEIGTEEFLNGNSEINNR